MTTVSVKEVREQISLLLSRAEHGEEIMITRHGKGVARLVGVPLQKQALPRLGEFRNTIKVSGVPLSKTVLLNRHEERY